MSKRVRNRKGKLGRRPKHNKFIRRKVYRKALLRAMLEREEKGV